MKNKNGFTLIELLAVIAVLAILVVIAVPNVIEAFRNAKNKTFIQSTYSIVNSAEKYYLNKSISNPSYSGETIDLDNNSSLKLEGDIASGEVEISSAGKVSIATYDEDLNVCATKDFNDKKLTITEYIGSVCETKYKKIVLYVSNSGLSSNDGLSLETPIDNIYDAYNALNGANGIIYVLSDIENPLTDFHDENSVKISGYNNTPIITRGTNMIEDERRSGLLYIYGESSKTTITLENITINSENINRGIEVYSNGKLIINSGTTIENGKTYNGSGACIYASGEVIMNDGLITNCRGYGAGAVALDSGVFTMNGGTISYSTGQINGGGAINVLRATFNLNGGNIENNSTSSYGGGFYIHETGTLNMSGGSINNNTATYGAGIDSIGLINITGGEISNNSAQTGDHGSGGGINSAGRTIISNLKMDNNSGTSGGAISSTGYLKIDNSEFTNNNASYSSGAVTYYGTDELVISNTKFIGNHSYSYVGALSSKPNTILNNCTFTDNYVNSHTTGYNSTSYGGAIGFTGEATLTINGGIIQDNTTDTGEATAIYISENATLINNGATIVGTCSYGKC